MANAGANLGDVARRLRRLCDPEIRDVASSGLSAASLRIVIGEIKSIAGNQPHAWCAAYLDGAWRTLDNKFDQIIGVADYVNWLPLAAMHDASVVRFGREFTLNDMMR
jgi:hypothetical protein